MFFLLVIFTFVDACCESCIIRNKTLTYENYTVTSGYTWLINSYHNVNKCLMPFNISYGFKIENFNSNTAHIKLFLEIGTYNISIMDDNCVDKCSASIKGLIIKNWVHDFSIKTELRAPYSKFGTKLTSNFRIEMSTIDNIYPHPVMPPPVPIPPPEPMNPAIIIMLIILGIIIFLLCCCGLFAAYCRIETEEETYLLKDLKDLA